MKKVAVVFTSIHFPMHILRFVTKMAGTNSWALNAIFVHDEPSETTYPFPNDLGIAKDSFSEQVLHEEEHRLDHIDAQIFSKACKDANIDYDIQTNVSLKQLLADSAGFDLTVLDKGMKFYTFSMLELLEGLQSPVCLISSCTTPLENVILAYDGSDAARHAIDSFTTIFAGLHRLRARVVSVNIDDEDLGKDTYLGNLPRNQFVDFSLVSLTGNVKQELDSYVKKYEHDSMVVMGALGRSDISQLFHPSVGKAILRGTDVSLFIAHE